MHLIDDIMLGAEDLDPTTMGIYVIMLEACYHNEGVLEGNCKDIASYIGQDGYSQHVGFCLVRFFIKQDEYWRHPIIEENYLEPETPSGYYSGQAMMAFNYWLKVMNNSKPAEFTPEIKAAVIGRMVEGATVDKIKKAIDGCAKSKYHMGDNTMGRKYNSLELICSSKDRIIILSRNAER